MQTPLPKKAFTLIELLVVIAVISLISSIVYASISSARQKAAVTQASSQARELRNNVAIAQDILAAGITTSSTLTNTNPNIGLSEKPELAKTIFPQFEDLSSEPSGPNSLSELEKALPKVSNLVSGTEEDEDYVYVSNGSQACVTSNVNGGSYLYPPSDITFHEGRCAPVRCGTMGEADQSLIMYRLDTSDYYPNVEDTPGYNEDKVVMISTVYSYTGVANWQLYPYGSPTGSPFYEGEATYSTFQMMCQ